MPSDAEFIEAVGIIADAPDDWQDDVTDERLQQQHQFVHELLEEVDQDGD